MFKVTNRGAQNGNKFDAGFHFGLNTNKAERKVCPLQLHQNSWNKCGSDGEEKTSELARLLVLDL